MREIRDIHEPFATWLNWKGIPFHRNRPDKKTTAIVGDPDFLITLKNRCLYIECKIPGEHLSEEQEKRILYLREAGNTVLICYSLEMCIEAVQTHLRMESPSSSDAEKQGEEIGKNQVASIASHPQNLFIGRIGMIDYVMQGDGVPGSTAKRIRVASAADIINIR